MEYNYKKNRTLHKRGKYNPKTRKNFKKMNCSPVLKNKTVNSDSCLTSNILLKIKAEYNKDHPDNIIKQTDNNEIWHELKTRLGSKCETEECWLNEIDDTILRKKIDELIFAPKQPPEWKDNPDEWLSNFDIIEVLKQYEQAYPKFILLGPTPIDFDSKDSRDSKKCVEESLCHFSLNALIKKGKTKIGVVFNLDKHTGPGSHWVSLFIDVDQHYIMYFDSGGGAIKKEIAKLAERVLKQAKDLKIKMKLISDKGRVSHQRGTTECGMYSLYFITTLLTEKAGNGTVLDTVDKKVRHFRSKRIPDEFVFSYRKKLFNSFG